MLVKRGMQRFAVKQSVRKKLENVPSVPGFQRWRT